MQSSPSTSAGNDTRPGGIGHKGDLDSVLAGPYAYSTLDPTVDDEPGGSRRGVLLATLGTVGLAGLGAGAAYTAGWFGGDGEATAARRAAGLGRAGAEASATTSGAGSPAASSSPTASSTGSATGSAGTSAAGGMDNGSPSGSAGEVYTDSYADSYSRASGGSDGVMLDPLPPVSGPRVTIDPYTGLPPGKGSSRKKAGGSTPNGAAAQPATGPSKNAHPAPAPPAAATRPRTSEPSTSLPQGGSTAPVSVPVSAAELVLQRATYGAGPKLRAQIAAQGIGAWLGRQLAPANVADPDGDAVLARFPSLKMSPLQLKRRYDAGDTAGFNPQSDLQGAHLGLAVHSSRQLYEVMVGFWSDHFTVPVGADDGRHFRTQYDAKVIRPNALGRFEDLLVAVTYSGSMMQYLDLNGSTGKNPNENFARELLELHTVGVDGGYTEADIKEAAKLLTGWRIERDTMQIEFRPQAHYVGAVTVMGFTHANASADQGPQAARELLAHLAHHRSTATFLAAKLARHFVADSPPPDLIARLADVYLTNDTQIAAVLRALFASPEFAASAGQKLRRPMEHLAGVARALELPPGNDATTLVALARALGSAGHAPFDWPTPDGYPDVAAGWQSAGQALRQFGLSVDLVQGRRKGAFAYPKPEDALSDKASATTPAAITAQLCQRLFGRKPTAAESTAVTSILSGPGAAGTYAAGSTQQSRACAVALVLLFHSPSFLTH